ncbi:MAG: GTP cyclohydrolase II, partial [Spirochaetota bacterium]
AEDGEMLREQKLKNFAAHHNLCLLNVEDIAMYRQQILGHEWDAEAERESRFAGISLQAETQVALPSNLGHFQACAVEDARDIGAEHLLIWKGLRDRQENPLLRIHSECFTGEVLFSQRCDCRAQLDFALEHIEAEGQGLLIYLCQEGRGIGLRNKLRAYNIQQQQNLDTVEANTALGFADDLREYSVAVGVLRSLKIRKVRLLTNNPHKVRALETAGIEVERVPINVGGNPHNQDYLATKKNKSGHLL